MNKRTWNKGKAYTALINSTEWRKVRRVFLVANPLCVRCVERGISQLAEVVHHVKPLENYISSPALMRRLAYDHSNLQALCHKCHNEVHIELDSRSVEANRHRKSELLKSFVAQWLDRS